MTIKRTEDFLEVKDNPTVFWLFYSVFVLGGGVVIFMGLTLVNSGWQSILALTIGMGNVLGGAYMLKREPASIFHIDLRSKTLHVTRWGVFGRSQVSHPIDAAREARLDVTEHTDGGRRVSSGSLANGWVQHSDLVFLVSIGPGLKKGRSSGE